MRLLLVAALAALLAACGAGRTLVLESADIDPGLRFEAASLDRERDTVAVPDEVAAEFTVQVRKAFFEKGLFDEGAGLSVRYRFVLFDAGNRAARWFTGGIGNAGEASAMIEFRFFSPDGEELSKIQVEGRIGSGFFGGSTDSALRKAAQEAAAYAANAFGRHPVKT